MRGVTARTFTETCSVERSTEGPPDRGGHRPLVWSPHLAGVRCKLLDRDGDEFYSPDKGTMLRATRVLQTAWDQDITEADRIVNVREADGTLHHPGPLNVRKASRAHGTRTLALHLEARR